MAVPELTIAKTKTASRWYPPPQGEWTYEDYLHLPDDGLRYEVIGGNLYMSPAPRPKHQKILLKLIAVLYDFVYGQELGEIYHAPIDVILPEQAAPVQPDLLYIPHANLEIVGETNIEGTPDLIVEVLSPGNATHDQITKFQAYAQSGVKEYWIVDGEAGVIDVFVLRGRAYAPLGRFTADEIVASEVLPALQVKVSDICAA